MDGSDAAAAAADKPANGEDSGGRAVDVSCEDTLPNVFRSFVDGVCASPGKEPLLRRLRDASSTSAPRLRHASRNSARDLVAWTKRGSGLRALFVISVGSITLIALTGLLIFMFFLFVATANAIIISVLMSLAAAGGFLAMFFACLAAVYIGAVTVAVFVISAATILTIIAVMIATGWISFFWMVWFAARKSLDLTKQSVGMTGSAIQAYTTSRHAKQKHMN